MAYLDIEVLADRWEEEREVLKALAQEAANAAESK